MFSFRALGVEGPRGGAMYVLPSLSYGEAGSCDNITLIPRANELVIHFRSSDLLNNSFQMQSTFAPCAFFDKVIEDHNFEHVRIVTEADQAHPCIETMKEQHKNISVLIQTSSFQQDTCTLMNAKHLAFASPSSFLQAFGIELNTHLNTVYSPYAPGGFKEQDPCVASTESCPGSGRVYPKSVLYCVPGIDQVRGWDDKMKYVIDYDDSKVSFNPTLFTRNKKQSQYFNKKIVDERLLSLNIFDENDINFFIALAQKLNLEFKLDVKTLWWGISSNDRKTLEENLSKHPYELISRFVRATKTFHYKKLLLEKKKLERECILKHQLPAMLECDNDRFKQLLAGRSYVITEYGPKPPVKHIGADTQIYNDLLNLLEDKDKIWILVTGRTYDGEIVWNNGNITTLEDDLLNKLNNLQLLDNYNEFKETYGMLRYRGKHNRHGHDNNKPSYYSLSGGLSHSKRQYFETLSVDQQIKYDTIHYDCCGNTKRFKR